MRDPSGKDASFQLRTCQETDILLTCLGRDILPTIFWAAIFRLPQSNLNVVVGNFTLMDVTIPNINISSMGCNPKKHVRETRQPQLELSNFLESTVPHCLGHVNWDNDIELHRVIQHEMQ